MPRGTYGTLDPKVALEHLCKYDAFLEKDVEANLMHQIAKVWSYIVPLCSQGS